MKLNFWQTIGLIVVAIAGVLIVIRETTETKPDSKSNAPATTTAH